MIETEVKNRNSEMEMEMGTGMAEVMEMEEIRWTKETRKEITKGKTPRLAFITSLKKI